MAAHLKPWPNRLGYTYREWNFMPHTDGTWEAVRRSRDGRTIFHGSGPSWREAMRNATPRPA